MNTTRPLPNYLVQRYHGWRATSFTENRAWYRRLADDGQRPRAMVISCCVTTGASSAACDALFSTGGGLCAAGGATGRSCS